MKDLALIKTPKDKLVIAAVNNDSARVFKINNHYSDGDIAFRQHKGGHTTGPDWPTFIKYAEKYFK